MAAGIPGTFWDSPFVILPRGRCRELRIPRRSPFQVLPQLRAQRSPPEPELLSPREASGCPALQDGAEAPPSLLQQPASPVVPWTQNPAAVDWNLCAWSFLSLVRLLRNWKGFEPVLAPRRCGSEVCQPVPVTELQGAGAGAGARQSPKLTLSLATAACQLRARVYRTGDRPARKTVVAGGARQTEGWTW